MCMPPVKSCPVVKQLGSGDVLTAGSMRIRRCTDEMSGGPQILCGRGRLMHGKPITTVRGVTLTESKLLRADPP